MAASVQFRPHERDLGMVMREVDENLAIFLGIKNIESKGFDEPKSERIEPVRNDYFLDSEIDKNGYDWLIAQPVTDSAKNPTELSPREGDDNRVIELPSNTGSVAKSERIEPVQNNYFLDSEIDTNGYDWLIAQSVNESTKNPTGLSPREGEDNRVIELPSNTGSVAKNSATGAKRRPLSLSGDRKPTPRAPTPPGQRPVAKPKTSRASTPTPARPSSRPTSTTSSKPRSSTPGRKDAHTKPVAPDSRKAGPTASRGTNQTVKSRPSKTSETQIGKTSSSRRLPNGNAGAKDGNNIVMPKVRGCGNGDGDVDDVNPVAMGTKMVERVVNMRKLAPPKQDEKKPSSSLSNSGFGRSLSKKSLDMAIRHMGIKGSIHDGLSPVTTGLSSSARGGHLKICKSSTVGVPESPVTSSSDSSKSSDGSSSYFLDGRCMDY